jgi:DNA mismatch repair protein MSH4
LVLNNPNLSVAESADGLIAQIMNDRIGVINMHLSVNMSEENKMIMIYKLARGFVQEDHYGLALARVVDLPPKILEVAEKVSKALDAQAAAKKQSSKARAISKRRKLVLGLREQLMQARDSPMEGKVLLSWLRRLQEAFVERMEQISNDAAAVDQCDEEIPDSASKSDDHETGEPSSQT